MKKLIKKYREFKSQRKLKKFDNYKFSVFTQVKYRGIWCDIHSVNLLNKTVELDYGRIVQVMWKIRLFYLCY